MIGGGSGRLLQPGAVSLAHQGVLFIDEAPELASGVLDALRQPLEEGLVTISRSGATARFPARFTLVLAANPCPCAAAKQVDCGCPPSVRHRYLARISGPLLDRIDLKLWLAPAGRAELSFDLDEAEPSTVVAERVLQARDRTARRLAGTPWRTNAEIPGPELRRRFPVPTEACWPAERALRAGALSARGLDRVLRVAWTLADLEGRETPADHHISEAYDLWNGKRA
jgi:magnesium chelatase family protein